MNAQPGDVPMGAMDQKTDKTSLDNPSTPPVKTEDVERNGASSVVDAATEARILRKLDIRIIPMICWIYLMNFMDRGEFNKPMRRIRLIEDSQYR